MSLWSSIEPEYPSAKTETLDWHLRNSHPLTCTYWVPAFWRTLVQLLGNQWWLDGLSLLGDITIIGRGIKYFWLRHYPWGWYKSPSDSVHKSDMVRLLIKCKIASLARMSSKDPQLVARIPDDNVDACDAAAPCLVLTIPSIILKACSCISSNLVFGWGDDNSLSRAGLLLAYHLQGLLLSLHQNRASICFLGLAFISSTVWFKHLGKHIHLNSMW